MKPYDHIGKGTSFRILKTNFCAGLGNCSEIVDHVRLRRANTSITDAQNFVLLDIGSSKAKLDVRSAVSKRR